MKEKLLDLFGDVFEVHDTVYVMDATAPGSAACRALKQYLADCKAKVTQVRSGCLIMINQVVDWILHNSDLESITNIFFRIRLCILQAICLA